MTITLSNLPDDVERALLERARAEQKSVDQAAVDAMARGLGVRTQEPGKHRELSDIAGTRRNDDPGFEAAIREQGLIDWEEWCDGATRRDLTGIAGQHLITPEMKEVFAEQRRIDTELW
jgi:hypothetical protein